MSIRVNEISDSVTLRLNDQAVKMAEEGKTVYNLTTGQLASKPDFDFIDSIKSELNFLKSYQYSPVAGFVDLREKLISYIFEDRHVSKEHFANLDCVISNGGKHNLFHVLLTLVDPGDEVIVISPFWISYPEMIKLCGGKAVYVDTRSFDAFTPSLEAIKKSITPKTKAIIINSPNNPAGIHYSDEWMKGFAELMIQNENVTMISDEIYFELSYFDPAPTYFYNHRPELLSRTVISSGISKCLASTGLRIGYCIAPKKLCSAISKLQSHTASGASSLIQRALASYEFKLIPDYLRPIKNQLRVNAGIVREVLRSRDVARCWYQPLSAFYFMLDLSLTPVFDKYVENKQDHNDYSMKICEDILNKCGVALVPGTAFGFPNSARISMVLEKTPFQIAMEKVADFLIS